MYCVYKVKIEEYRPGFGWFDDGHIYSTDKVKLEREAQRRVSQYYSEQTKVRSSTLEIVVVHETFLRDLKITPVLSTLNGPHPADLGNISEYNKLRSERDSSAADFQYLKNTSDLSKAA